MEHYKKPKDCLDIEEIRCEIDKIDNQIIELFSIRDEYIKEIVSFKKDEEGVVAQERKEYVIKERARIAAQKGLNPDLFKKIFTILIEENIKKELELLQTNRIKSS